MMSLIYGIFPFPINENVDNSPATIFLLNWIYSIYGPYYVGTIIHINTLSILNFLYASFYYCHLYFYKIHDIILGLFSKFSREGR